VLQLQYSGSNVFTVDKVGTVSCAAGATFQGPIISSAFLTGVQPNFNVGASSTHGSGAVVVARLATTYNQAASTAANTDLQIQRTETSLGSGAQLFIDCQAGGVSQFKVDNAGNLTGKSAYHTHVDVWAASGNADFTVRSGDGVSFFDVYAQAGASTLGIYDANTGATPFKIGASVPSNALVLSSTGTAIGGRVGFNGTTPPAKPTVTGSRGANAALASLLSALASTGLLTDSST
jgi:hypothetical protein